MKKAFVLFLMAVMMICLAGSASAIVLPEHLDNDPSNDPVISESSEETVSEIPENYYIDFTPCFGFTNEEMDAFIEAHQLEKNCVITKTSNYTDANGESKFGVSYIRFEKGGIGALGFSMNGEFDRQITPEMEAEGWTLPRAQFEGGFWYVTAEKTAGDAVYSVRMMIDGSKIFSLEISVNDLNAHFAAMAAEEVQE